MQNTEYKRLTNEILDTASEFLSNLKTDKKVILVLGITYSRHRTYVTGERAVPKYIAASIEAHSLLSTTELKELLQSRAAKEGIDL